MSRHYESLNLRFNPFGELDRETRALLAVVDVAKFQPMVGRRNSILQFLADHGRGKSTHLLALHRANPDIPYTQLHVARPSYELQSGDRHFVDSIENLPFLCRRKLYRQYDWLAVTTHRDLRWEMYLAGKQVKTIHISQNDPKVLLTLFNRRIEHARRYEGELPWLTLSDITYLQLKCRDNIRAMEAMLYDHFYCLKQKGEVHGNISSNSGHTNFYR